MKYIEKELKESLEKDIQKINRGFSEKIAKLELMYKEIQELEKDKVEILEIQKKVISILSSYPNSTVFELTNIREKINLIDKEINTKKMQIEKLIKKEEEFIDILLDNVHNETLKNEILKYKKVLENYKI